MLNWIISPIISGILASVGQIPSLHFIFFVHRRFRVVRSVVGQTLLHEAVFTLCLDPCCPFDSRHSKLFNHPQYFPRTNLVFHMSSYDFVCLLIRLRASRRDKPGLSYPFRWLSATTLWRTCLASSSAVPRSSSCHLRKPGKVSLEAALPPLFLDWWWTKNKLFSLIF